MEDVMDYINNEPEIAVRMRNKNTNNIITLWDFAKFSERLEMMLNWYHDMDDDGILNRERYFDPWNVMTDEEMLFYYEDDEETIENQKARLMMFINQNKVNK